jgi:ubiquinone/menaquinone biosynthesis C-methylase UbiE
MTLALVVLGMMIVLGALIWWLVFETEGVYLGKRAVIWLYDVYATRYDRIVQHDDFEEHMTLAQPLLNRCRPHTNPRLLDVATGTGRIPLALCQHARFDGHITALDRSRGMLAQAERKISDEHFAAFVTFIWSDGQHLPFSDNSFDVVTCMEALEFMPQPEQALGELARVLRPGGLLLTTQRINQPFMPDRIWSQAQMQAHLETVGLVQVSFEAWQYDYTQVWARKAGSSRFIGIGESG